MPRLLTRSQYARRGWRDPQTGEKIKYTRQRITQLVKQGVITLKGDKIDPAQADVAIGANIDRSRRVKEEKKRQAAKTPQLKFSGNGFNNETQRDTTGNGFNTEDGNGKGYEGKSLTETRRDLEEKKIILHEIKIKELRGELVPKGEATKMVVALGFAIKLAFLNLPRRLADILATMNEPKEIEILLRSEIKNIIHILEQSHHEKPKRVRSKNSRRRLAGHLETSG
jgi:hypothetical protein